jgi:hypothetical protein
VKGASASRLLALGMAMVTSTAFGANGPAHATPRQPSSVLGIRVTDIGLKTKFQDGFFGHLKRGRTLVAADFDMDGRIDFWEGNPGQESFVMHNVAGPRGQTRFEAVDVLLTGNLAGGGVAIDYDNDGDPDIFETEGSGEGIGFNHLFRNNWKETGQLTFTDVTQQAGVSGPVPPGETDPIPVATVNAVSGDYDNDGWIDLFCSVAIVWDSPPQIKGRNILWHNNHDGTFSDATDQVGLGSSFTETRDSTWIDIDNDGDLDLFQNNWQDYNILWRNRLVEDGVATFEDVTALFSPPGENLAYPYESFVSAAADFNNDGWQDLMVFTRSVPPYGPEPGSPYPEGHALFLNTGGTGFVNVAQAAGLNNPFQEVLGVMGCQLGDVSGDGMPDIYIGNGGVDAGTVDQFYLSDSLPGAYPHFTDATSLTDFKAPEGNNGLTYPPYPYRTHGTDFVDIDGDGQLEMAVANGGAAISPDTVEEPNRMFQFRQTVTPNWFKVQAVGNGATVSKDAIGARMTLTVSKNGGTPWAVHRTIFGGSCFSGQNPLEQHFGLGRADTIESLEIAWPDGTVQTLTGLSINSAIVVQRSNEAGNPGRPSAEPWSPSRIARFLAAQPTRVMTAGTPRSVAVPLALACS